jgi:branched-chain amino acid transport system substrate-binding protein
MDMSMPICLRQNLRNLGVRCCFRTSHRWVLPIFAPYCTELGKYVGKAEVLHFVYSGMDAIRFVTTAEEYGLTKKFTMTNWGATEDGSMLTRMKTGAEGGYHISINIFNVKKPENDVYMADNKKKGGIPDPLDYYGYIGSEVILRALEKVQGNIEAREEFLKALREVKFESPTGPFEFDQRSQQAVLPLFISQARKAGGELGDYQNALVKVINRPQDPWWIGR